MAVFGEPTIRQTTKATICISGYRFNLSGMLTLNEGWLRFYKPYVQTKDTTLPPLTQGQKISVKTVVTKKKFTKPPARYNPRTLLLKMEKEDIGTKATRAATIQTLYDRKYIQGNESLAVSDLGFEIIEILVKYCPTVVSPQLTRTLEKKMNEIQQGKETKKAALQNAVEILKPVLLDFKEKESVIGEQISQVLKEARLKEKMVGACPACADGKLVILRSKKTGKRFVGCTNYFKGKCNVTFPLPQSGIVKPLNATCKSCGYAILRVWIKGKRSWKLCLNPNCPSKEARNQKT
jgi:DNA topoisomerase-1